MYDEKSSLLTMVTISYAKIESEVQMHRIGSIMTKNMRKCSLFEIIFLTLK